MSIRLATPNRKTIIIGSVILILLAVPLVVINKKHVRSLLGRIPIFRSLAGRKTTEQQIDTYGDIARKRLVPMFESKELKYPPEQLAMVAIKDKKELEIYASTSDGGFKLVRSYPILGASGNLGPKLREGDCQVPEGIYRIQSLEPNTPYHLGLRVNYPNAFDLQHAQAEGRNPGGDILIHGNTGSVGCLAMGDEASEDLFVMCFDVKDQNIPLIMCPVDLRSETVSEQKDEPSWLPGLYGSIKEALAKYPQNPKPE